MYKQIKKEIDEFLLGEKMHFESIDFEIESTKFAKEMERGLSGGGSLKMLPAYIQPTMDFNYNRPVIIIDAGGTNFRCAVVTITEKDIKIEHEKRYPMPGSKDEISKDEFINKIIDFIEPIIEYSDSIGFCFSYPVEIMPNADGKVISLTKEIRVNGIEDMLLGKELLDKLNERGYKGIKNITILNDTTAALLSGITKDYQYNSYIGLIVGTGINSCYIEVNESIWKNDLLSSNKGSTVINLESGGYDKISRGTIDNSFDKTTINPREQLMEKMISGAYLGSLVLETFKKASSKNILSKKLCKKFLDLPELGTKELSDFLNNPYKNGNTLASYINSFGGESDRKKLYYIIDIIVERAAKIIAINIKGILIKINKGKNPCKPVCLTIDGSTFYKFTNLQRKFNYYLKKYILDKGYYVKTQKVEHGIMIGTAMAVLLKSDDEMQNQ